MNRYIDAKDARNLLAARLHQTALNNDELDYVYEDIVDNRLDIWLNEIPAADIPQWIPVTDRLPAYGEVVLLSMSGDCSIGYLVPTYDERRYEWHHSGWFYDFNEVDAWMPLPEPYKGGEEE